ncbi:hypothetical protein [Luteibacter sp. 9135]|uniref:hypothetical protein n=1 Tax=Luteibacter sp. 9135 TaxID=1500893 RepID=UPI00055AA153|nr:hypothetical protein [Luteibacter sp. 9135]
MRDTIELLETFGRDATLRYATADEMARTLTATGASAGLHELLAKGDGGAMKRELGLGGDGWGWQVEHQSQTGAHEDEDDLLMH